jgi:hypothetical protein
MAVMSTSVELQRAPTPPNAFQRLSTPFLTHSALTIANDWVSMHSTRLRLNQASSIPIVTVRMITLQLNMLVRTDGCAPICAAILLQGSQSRSAVPQAA